MLLSETLMSQSPGLCIIMMQDLCVNSNISQLNLAGFTQH